MTIGIPRALGYYRYGTLWETFLQELDIPYVTSGETTQQMLEVGAKHSVDESCLPQKLYMGHVSALLDRADRILVPRLEHMGKRDEFCVRFWGLPDTVQATFTDACLLTYELKSKHPRQQEAAFLRMGKTMGRGSLASLRAYRRAVSRQRAADFRSLSQSRMSLRARGTKILLAGSPYIVREKTMGGVIAALLKQMGVSPVFPDAWDREQCKEEAQHLSRDLYWTFQREALGAIHLSRGQVDGIILLTAFPCGSDCLANELVLRRTDGIPVIQIILDEHQGREGLLTRLESFLDMIESGRGRE